ncbi:hypothetical protein [Ralstonia solanacearum]|uniref:hypothetical protein n=1 Tax=Ralstonia solanacearum TaxID=305 RepID=UPI001F1510BE|nr:hypothetical protein [Ralstonia solanacearum]
MIFDTLFESRSSLENPEVPLTGRNLQEWLHGDGVATVTEQTAMRLTAARALEDLNPREGLSELLISVNARPLNEATPAAATVTQP